MTQELLEKIDKNEMPKDEYECINESESSSSGRPAGPGGRTGRGGGQIRSRRKAAQTKSDDGHSRLTFHPFLFVFKNSEL